jgi:signal transduction histidine kinase/ligand-binding sensor domain-containing protein
MSWRLIITVTLFINLTTQVNAQELPFTHYNTDREINPLPSAMVTHVYQDHQGFIWMSVFSSGLIRFDGNRMELFDHLDGLVDPGIWKTTEDTNGYFWIISNAGLYVSVEPLKSYQHGRRVQFTSEPGGTQLYREALSKNQFTADYDGNVWIGSSDNGLIQYRMENGGIATDTISTELNGTGNESVISLQSLKDQSILAGLNGGVLIQIKNGELHVLDDPENHSSNQNIISIYQDQDNSIWVYRQNGEIQLYQDLSELPQTIHRGQPSNIASFTTISDNTIWVSNGIEGIIKINRNSGVIIDNYTRKNGLLSDNAFHILQDREMNVWIAQSGGVSKLRFNFHAFQNFSARSMAGETPSLPSARVNAVLVLGNTYSPCKVWVGTEGGLTCIDEDNRSHFITQDDGLQGDWVNGLAGHDSETLWIATTQGLNGITFSRDLPVQNAVDIRTIELNEIQATIFSIEESPPFIAAENLQLLHQESENYFESSWFPGLRSLYAVIDSDIFEFNAVNGLPSTLYKSVAFDQNGFLWVGTLDRGIYRSRSVITMESLHQSDISEIYFDPFWTRSEGAPTNHIEKLLLYNNKMWVGTQEGLFVLNPETAEIKNHISTDSGLVANNAVSFAISPVTNHLWIGTNRGLSEYSPESDKILRNLTRLDGLIDNEVWLYGSVQADEYGNIYYGTANGLSIYHPDYDRPNTVAPALHLNLADISYQAEGRNEVTFEYTALSYATNSGVRYQTRLSGYNSNWSPETTETRLRYTNLPALFFPKEYTFEVIAFNESGVPSEEPIQFTFMIIPVWWLQWWAFLIYFFIFSAGVFIVDRVQRARLIKKERDASRLREAELQAETALERSKASEAQTKALKAENDRKALELEKARELEKAYHELKATQNQLVQAEKMASLGRLSAGIAHEIKNPLNFINNFANVSTELVEELIEAIRAQDQGEIEYILQNLRFNTNKIEEHGKRADSIVRSMMQHARGGKSTFEEFDLNLLVEKYTDLAYHGKRAQIPDFYTNISTEFHPDIKKINIVGQEIGQVLLNIIGNSLDAVWEFKKNGGDKSFTPEIKISTRKHGNSVEIRISDNGPGVPKEIREKIFEPFFTTKPTGEGTGLGLSLSYDIITQGHNGSLRLESDERNGATFVITLPA